MNGLKKKLLIDLDNYKLNLHINNYKLNLHFDSESRRFYLAVIALIVHEMIMKNEFCFLKMDKLIRFLALFNETIGGSAGSSERSRLLKRLYRKWKGDLSNLERARLFRIIGKIKQNRSYDIDEKINDDWAGLFEYNGSEENVSLRFSIDKLGIKLNEVSIIFEEKEENAWKRFIKSVQTEAKYFSEQDFQEGELHKNKKTETISQKLSTVIHKSDIVLEDNFLVLSPAEEVLQIKPISADFANPKFFRKTGPVAVDIDAGFFYIPDEVMSIINDIEHHRKVLLHGVAGTGKSVVSRIIAYNWIKDNKIACFVELKKKPMEIYELLIETNKLGSNYQDSLLIIEDSHLNAQLINNYLSKVKDHWPKLLITSRDNIIQVHEESVNYFKLLHQIKLDSLDLADKIIEKYFKTKIKEGWQLSEKLYNEIKAYSKESLWVLSYALLSLNETQGKEIREETVLSEVKRDLDNLKLLPSKLSDIEKELFIPILVSLANFYCYEIPTDVKALKESINCQNEYEMRAALNELVKFGEIFSTERNKTQLFGLPHSSLANLYQKFSKDYLYTEDKDSEKLISEYEFSSNKINLWPFIEERKLADAISHFDDIWSASDFIKAIYNVNPSVLRKLWHLIDKAKLAYTISHSNDIQAIGDLLKTIYKANPFFALEIWQFVDKGKLSTTIYPFDDTEVAKNKDLQHLKFVFRELKEAKKLFP